MTLRALKNSLLAVCLLFFAGSLTAQDYVKSVDVTAKEAKLTMAHQFTNDYLLVVTGPNDYYKRAELKSIDAIKITSLKEDGQAYEDGSYSVQITPIFSLTEEQQLKLRQLTANKDQEGLAAFRLAHNLPARVDVHNVHFRVHEGKFIIPEIEEMPVNRNPFEWNSYNEDTHGYPSMFAGLNQKHHIYGKSVNVSPNRLATDNTSLSEDAQVFTEDVIVQGSLCVGIDCPSSQSFGFDTQILKENNLRLFFDDTSNSASFPGTDWRIVINDSSNGGANYFAVQDATANRNPFVVEGGAFANTLYVDSSKKVGINNASPVVELHVTDGDSPTVRLEQDGSSGFGAQTWDIAGNETNFFIRDVTNGSLLPFRIKPSAPKNSIFIWQNGNVGLGVPDAGPTEKLQIESGNLHVKSGKIGVNVVPTQALDVLGNFKVTGSTFVTGDITATLGTNGASFFNSSFQTVLRLDAANARVGIGVQVPSYQLQLSTDQAYKPSGGDWLASSDRRLKQDIKDFNDGLEVLMGIRPVSYRYNGKLDLPTDKEYIGVIAQEIQEVAPYTVEPMKTEDEAAKKENYLAYDGTPLTYILINAVQEQQAIIDAQQKEIDALKAEVTEVEALKAQMSSLAKMVAELKAESDATNNEAQSEE